jgi:hypothetical protein
VEARNQRGDAHVGKTTEAKKALDLRVESGAFLDGEGRHRLAAPPARDSTMMFREPLPSTSGRTGVVVHKEVGTFLRWHSDAPGGGNDIDR